MQIDESDFQQFITIKERLTGSSVHHCMSRFRLFMGWMQENGYTLTKEIVEKYFAHLKEKGLTNNSLNTYGFMFYHLVSYCRDRGLSSDFYQGFKSFRKNKSDIIILTHEEIEKIIRTELVYGKFRGNDCNYLNEIYQTMIMFLAYTGCRYSEAAELTVKHLDISAGKAIFINTKTNENRTVYYTEPLKSLLQKLIQNRKPTDRVFRNMTGKQIQTTDFSEDLKRRAKESGVTKRVHPHIFRHSYITHMLEADIPITQVASLAGHKDIRTTYSTYMHLADKTLERAAMKHPMVRRNVDPGEILQAVRDEVDNFHLEKDARFKYRINRENSKLIMEISVLENAPV